MHTDYTLWDLVGSLVSTKADRANVLVATAMVASPWWLQYLKNVSDIAAMLAPILGCVLVGIQIWGKIKRGR